MAALESSDTGPFQVKLRNYRRLLSMTGGCLIQLTLGHLFTAGNISPYVMSYLKDRVDPSVKDSSAVWITSVSLFSLGLPMFLGGYMERTFGARITCFCGGVVFCGSIALSYFAVQHSFLAFLFTYAFSSYCGASLSYGTIVTMAMKCYPEHKSLASGVVLGFNGLGPLVLNQVQTSLINPHNMQIDPETGYFLDENMLNHVPTAFLYLGLIYTCVHLVGIGLLQTLSQETKVDSQEPVFSIKMTRVESSQHIGQFAMSNSAAASGDGPEKPLPASSEDLKDYSPKEMLKSKEFYMFWFTFALMVQSMMFVNSYYKIYDQQYADDEFLTSLGSGAAVLNFLGRILWGYLMDKSSYKTCMLLISLSTTVLMSTFFLTGPVGKALFGVWILILFFDIAGMVSLIPVAVAVAFGPTYSSVNFGLIYTSPATMSVSGSFLIEFLLKTVSWMGTCCILAGFSLTAFVITLFLPFDLNTLRTRRSR